MNKLIGSVALMTLASAWCVDAARAHGGTYAGPGDTVPPAGGGTTGGGPPTPGTPGPNTPNTPTPVTPGPAKPGVPTAPGGAPRGSPTTQGGGNENNVDLTRWQFWWELNKERYLDLKRHIYAGQVFTGSDGFFFDEQGAAVARDQMRPALETIRNVVVPGLLAALAKDSSNNDVLTGVMIALAKIGDVRGEDGSSPFADVMRSHLDDPNQEVAESAALALGILGDESNFEVLSALVRNDRSALKRYGADFTSEVPERTRAFAAYGLGLVGSRATEIVRVAIVSQLVDFLEHEGRSMRTRDVPVACVTALGLVPLLDDASASAADAGVHVSAASITSRETQVLWLRDLFLDQRVEHLLRAQAPRAMSKLTEGLDAKHWLRATVATTLLGALDEFSKETTAVQESAALALGGIGDCDGDELDVRIRAALMRVHGSTADQQLKRFSLIALAQVAGRPGESSEDPIAALTAKKQNPRTFLLERLEKGSSGERCWAALALAVEERALADAQAPTSSDVRFALRSALQQTTAADEVGAFAIALGIARDDTAKEVLRVKFDRITEPDARGYVALALGLVNDVESIPAIQRVVEKSKFQPDLLRSAAIALGLLGDQHVVESLIQMLSTASGLSSQAAIASALGTIGDARSIEPLIALMGDMQKTGRARGLAAAALGIVSDKDEHPWLSRISLDINYRANTPTMTNGDGTGVLEIL